ncbi:unnamed protein product [Linum tenue]|uniref:Uncharacterized protein n=1 Tax=Linum tenue TaxID=586396 RepID=A0AAV0S612_9ROSI|nr:unnamed protein product [Linum tenue]CAI0627566.1 unnamed protein product [Linum tenue]
MGSKGSFENAWADQWDRNQENHGGAVGGFSGNGDGAGGKGKYSKKMKGGLNKTKEVATAGMKKVKAGASIGMLWIKVKYQKTTKKASP